MFLLSQDKINLVNVDNIYRIYKEQVDSMYHIQAESYKGNVVTLVKSEDEKEIEKKFEKVYLLIGILDVYQM